MKRGLVVAAALLIFGTVVAGCATVPNERADGIRPSASPALNGPNNIDEISGPAGRWPTSG